MKYKLMLTDFKIKNLKIAFNSFHILNEIIII